MANRRDIINLAQLDTKWSKKSHSQKTLQAQIGSIAPRNEQDGYLICQTLKLRRSHKIQGIAYMIFDVMLTSSRRGTGWLCPPGPTTSAVAADPVCSARLQSHLPPGLWAMVHCGLVHQRKQATRRQCFAWRCHSPHPLVPFLRKYSYASGTAGDRRFDESRK